MTLTKKGVLRVIGLVDNPDQCYDDLEGVGFTCFALPSRCRDPTYNISTLNCVFDGALGYSEPMPPFFSDPATLIYVNGDVILDTS
eukprot:7268-Eustigmatos_ZCMA.PRE.1